MKNLILTSLFAIFTLAMQAQSTSFTTVIEGGVKGEATELVPNIELYALNGNNEVNTLIFNENKITGTTTITLTAANNNTAFNNFAQILASSNEHLLSVGHIINGVKSKSASSITGWFGDDANFIGENISSITITYTKVNFEVTDNWTNFSYEMTVKINGATSEMAKASR